MIRSKSIAVLVLTAAFGGVASGADFAALPYTKAPPALPAVYNWTGFYAGGHLGASWTNEQWVNTANTSGFGDLIPGQGFQQRGSGVFGGGQLGYNWQADSYVFGLEGTVSGLNNQGTLLNTVFGPARDDRFSWRTDWMVTAVARAGFTWANHLFYAKGGYAGINNRLSVLDTVPPVTGSGSATQWHNGWTVGAGWEYGITQNWIVGLEYDYAAFQTKSYELGGSAAPLVYTFDAKPRDVQWAVVRFSYRWGLPFAGY
jgi:outer membrane immunogenic protein